jgi:hypothetical protein
MVIVMLQAGADGRQDPLTASQRKGHHLLVWLKLKLMLALQVPRVSLV